MPLRFGIHPTFQRMVVDWPRPVGYRLDRADRTATFVFDAPAAFRDEQIATGLGQAAVGASTATDSRESRISIHLADGIDVRHFRTDAKVVIDLMHGGRAPAKAPAVPDAGSGTRPWEQPLPPREASAPDPTWASAQKALAPAPVTPPPVVKQTSPAAPAGSSARSAPVASPDTGTPVRLAAASPPAAAEPARPAVPTIPVPPWRKTVREVACRGDLDRATAILTERMGEAPLDPIDWYNLTWLLRTLAGATMTPPPLPADSPAYEAPLIGLCSGRPVPGTVASWQRLAHAGQFTEFLIDVAPAAAPPARR